MGAVAAHFWIGHLRVAATDERAEIWASARQNFAALLRIAPGVGARVLNDYAGTVVPILFIGTMNTSTVAATAVATKVYALFCRVPQAAFAACYVYYSYGIEEREKQPASEETRRIVRRLLRYAAMPTAFALAATLAASPWLVQLFGGGGIDVSLTRCLLLAYMLFVPFYFFEQFYGELLTAPTSGPAFCSARRPQPLTF